MTPFTVINVIAQKVAAAQQILYGISNLGPFGCVSTRSTYDYYVEWSVAQVAEALPHGFAKSALYPVPHDCAALFFADDKTNSASRRHICVITRAPHNVKNGNRVSERPPACIDQAKIPVCPEALCCWKHGFITIESAGGNSARRIHESLRRKGANGFPSRQCLLLD